MPKLRDRMTDALASAAVAAKEQGLQSDLRPEPAPTVETPATNGADKALQAPPAAEATPPSVAGSDPLAVFERDRAPVTADLVQFGFRCPRDLKREVERLCFEEQVTMQDFGQAALRLLLEELRHRRGANVQ